MALSEVVLRANIGDELSILTLLKVGLSYPYSSMGHSAAAG